MDQTALLKQLILHEGVRLSAYQDSGGFWTIGIGRNIDRRGGGISEEEALYLFNNDVARVSADLDRELPMWRELDEVRQRVLFDMAFNLGIAGLLKFHNALGAIRQGNYAHAAEEILDSRWASQVGPRATRLAAMMRNGEDPKH